MKQEIELGDKVRCIHTGFEGTAVCKSEFINGCIQWSVLPKGDKNNKMPEDMSVDEQSLEVISPKKKSIKANEIGGPNRKGIRLKGF